MGPTDLAAVPVHGEQVLTGNHAVEVGPLVGVDGVADLRVGRFGLLARAKKKTAHDGRVAPIAARALDELRNGQGTPFTPRSRLEDTAGLAGRDIEQAVLGGGHVRGVKGRAEAPRSRHVDLPERKAVVRVDAEQHLVAQHEDPPIPGQRGHVAVVAVDHEARSGTAKPLQLHRAADPPVVAAPRVGGIGVQVRPHPGVRQGAALGDVPALDRDAPIGAKMPEHVLNRDRAAIGRTEAVAHDEVCEPVRARQPVRARFPQTDRDASAV